MSNSVDRFQWNINTKTRRKKTIDYFVDLGVYMVLICNFFILWGNSQGIDLIVSWPTRLMVSYIFLLAIYLFITKATSNKAELTDALFVGLVAITAVCYVLTCKSALFGKLVQYMCFLMLPGCCVLYRHAGRVKELKKAIYIANVFYAFLFIALIYAPNSHIAYGPYGLEEVEELTLGYQNPNETAIYVMLSFFALTAAAFNEEKLTWKWCYGALAAEMYYIVLQTQSRTCIVLCTAFLVLALLQKRFKIGKKMLKVAVVLPVIILLIMMEFPQWIARLRFMGEVADTGRILIFNSFFENWDMSHAVLGDFLQYGGSNLHNSFLTLMGMFGLPTATFYMYFIYKNSVVYAEQSATQGAYLGYVGWIMLIIHGIAEGTLVAAGTVYAGMAGLMLILMLPEEKTE